MKAYDRGVADGMIGNRKDRSRIYETDKAEKAYWQGYIHGMKAAYPGKIIVQCERDGKIFAISSLDVKKIVCPTCARVYVKEGDEFHSDRKLTIHS